MSQRSDAEAASTGTSHRSAAEVETLWLLFQQAVDEAGVSWTQIHETFRSPVALQNFVAQLFEAEADDREAGLPSRTLPPTGIGLDVKLALLRRGTGVAPPTPTPKAVPAKAEQQPQQQQQQQQQQRQQERRTAPYASLREDDRRRAATTAAQQLQEEEAYRQQAWSSYCWSQYTHPGWQPSHWSGVAVNAAAMQQQQLQWQAAAAAQRQRWSRVEQRQR